MELRLIIHWVYFILAHENNLNIYNSLSYCDFFGEKLAWFFGITSPKYYYELEEYRREQEAEEERAKKEDIEIRGWRETSSAATSATTEDPPIELDPTKLIDSPRSPGSLTAS